MYRDEEGEDPKESYYVINLSRGYRVGSDFACIIGYRMRYH